MKITVKRAYVIYFFILAFIAGVVTLVINISINGATWVSSEANRHLYSRSKAVISAGPVYDRNGVILAQSEDNVRIYHEDEDIRMATLHVVGDAHGVISTGTQNIYTQALSGYSFADGIYTLKNSDVGPSITMNIDSEACRVAYEALGAYDGVVMAYNYQTGELLCSVSKPTYDLNNKPEDINTNPAYEGVYLDKAISGLYTPGSIMKIVTAICAIENIPDIYERTFNCDGYYEVGNYDTPEAQRNHSVVCNDTNGHGVINFEGAMNYSCNWAFAQIAIELGAEKLNETAESLGFNAELYAREIRIKPTSYHPPANDDLELGWCGIGQSTTLVNPCHFLTIMGAIANGGTGYAPDRIQIIDNLTNVVEREPVVMTTIDPDTAQKVHELLISNVENVYLDRRDYEVFDGMSIAGKTGTAQIDNGTSHSWFVGYSYDENLPIAIVVVAEHGGSGMWTATDIADEVMQHFYDNY